jgi:hypothetical protein
MALHDKLDQLRTDHIASLVARIDRLMEQRIGADPSRP